MVLLKTGLVGVFLISIGVFTLVTLGHLVTVPVMGVQHGRLEPHTSFVVGDVSERSYALPENSTISGYIVSEQIPTNTPGMIRLKVFDRGNHELWIQGRSAYALFSTESTGNSTYNFDVRQPGTYYFVFDNKASLFKEQVTFTVGYTRIVVSQTPNPNLEYGGWALLAIGIIVLAYSLVKRAPIPWSES